MNQNSLYELISKERQLRQMLAINGILDCFSDNELHAIDDHDDPFVKQKKEEILKFIKKASREDSFGNWKEAYSSYSEVCTYMRFKKKGIDIERVVERQGEKTPDFQIRIQDEKKSAGQEERINIEVKKLDWAQGEMNLKSLQNESYETYKHLEQERAKHRRLCTCIEVEATPLKKNGKIPSAAEEIDVLINKINQNVKFEQLQWENSQKAILVVDLSLIYGNMNVEECLPVFMCREALVSGRLWSIAFGKKGDRLFDLPEFNGRKNIVKGQESCGILQQFDYIGGLVFRVQEHNKGGKFYGFYRDGEAHSSIADILWKLCDYVNDYYNCFGYKLYKQKTPVKSEPTVENSTR